MCIAFIELDTKQNGTRVDVLKNPRENNRGTGHREAVSPRCEI